MFKLKTLTDNLHTLLSRRGYKHTYKSRNNGLTTTYESIYNSSKFTVDYDEIRETSEKCWWGRLVGYKINKINDEWIHSVKQANELLKKLVPFNYKVLPYSVGSSNYRYLKSLSNRINKLGVTIRDPKTLMEKLETLNAYKEYIQLIKRSYPDENPLAYFAMLCKVTVMRGQNRNVLCTYGFDERGFFKRIKIEDLHKYMKQQNLCWTNSWRYIRAIQIIRNEPRVRKENVKFSEKARSLKVDYTKKGCWYDHKDWCLADKFKKSKTKLSAELESHKKSELDESINFGGKRLSSLLNTGIGDTTVVLEGLAHNIGVMRNVDRMRIVIYKKHDSDSLKVTLKLKELGFSEDEYIITDDMSTSNYKNVIWFL